MNIALVGYGRMGHEIEAVAISRGHRVGIIIDQFNLADLNEVKMKGTDVAIEFTTPDSAFGNIIRCLDMKIPVVSGTTGWLSDYRKAVDVCLKSGTAFIHATNFSIGVNILFRLNSELARLISPYREYTPSIDETHHVKKLDSPSGTAITLSEGIAGVHPGYDGWRQNKEVSDKKIPIRSFREGMVPGTHTVTWDSEIDKITLKHEAKGRKGLALGAVVAAEFIAKRKGVFTMNDVLGI